MSADPWSVKSDITCFHVSCCLKDSRFVASLQFRFWPQEGDNFPLTYKGNQWTELQERSNMVNEFHPQNAAF